MKNNLDALSHLHSSGLSLRTVQQSDVSAITQLIYAVCEAEGDTVTAVTEEELLNEWDYEGFDPETDAFVVSDEKGMLLAYGAVYDVENHCELSGDIYLHPQAEVNSVGKTVLQAMQTRSKAHIPFASEGETVFLRVALDNRNAQIKSLFADLNFAPVRYHWRMEITFNDSPILLDLPDGLTIKSFNWQEHAAAVWQTRNEAFSANWGSRKLDFDEFTYYTKEHPEYDPSLWQIAWDGEKVAGFCINQMRNGIGWVHILGVHPSWRGKGLGKVLLQNTFNAFYQRGVSVIGLGVDAANESGATKLYENAGMGIISEFVTFEKQFT